MRRKAQCGFKRRLYTLPCDEEVVAHVRPTGELNPATSGMIGGGIPILGHISSIQAAVGIEDAEHPDTPQHAFGNATARKALLEGIESIVNLHCLRCPLCCLDALEGNLHALVANS